ncbi:MAG: hypothetical protein Q8J74_15040, partial [Candidatus Didemnitutus sp.]|nr:hypothetical protein [Candidatus Didemnitutus sp.]
QRIAENAVPFAQHEKDSRKFSQLAARVDQAWTLLHSPHFVTETLMEFGRTRPVSTRLDTVFMTTDRVVVRGVIHETSARASQILGNYVREMRVNPALTPNFSVVNLTDLRRRESDTVFDFEIVFVLKPKKP